MNLIQHLLVKLSEECSEVSQMAIKSSIFGVDEKWSQHTQNNRQRLEGEINDMFAVIEMLNQCCGVTIDRKASLISQKKRKVYNWLNYAVSLGTVQLSAEELDLVKYEAINAYCVKRMGIDCFCPECVETTSTIKNINDCATVSLDMLESILSNLSRARSAIIVAMQIRSDEDAKVVNQVIDETAATIESLSEVISCQKQ